MSGMQTRFQNMTFRLLQLLLLCFVPVSPFANKLDPALLLMAGVLLLLLPAAFMTLIRLERPVFEVWLFLPMLALSMAVGLLNGHVPSNVFRGIIPYLIYIIAFAAILFLPREKRFELLRFYILIVVLIALKTFVILVYNGVSPADIARGVRATFFDINSGLPMAMVTVPLVFAAVMRVRVRALILSVLVGQVLLGQSKSLMVMTLFFLVFFAISHQLSTRQVELRSVILLTKIMTVVIVSVLVILTFDRNPLLHRFTLMVTSPETELAGRLYEMQNVLMSLEKNPLLGRGQGYVFIHRAAGSPKDAPRYEERRYTHSILFYHLAIMGFSGFLFALLLLHGPVFYLVWRRLADLWTLEKTEGREMETDGKWHFDRLPVALILAGMGMLAFNLVSASYKNPQSLIMLALLNALVFTVLDRGRPGTSKMDQEGNLPKT